MPAAENIFLAALACYLVFGIARFAAEQPPSWPLFAVMVAGLLAAFILLVRADFTGRPALVGLVAFISAAVLGALIGKRRSSHTTHRSTH